MKRGKGGAQLGIGREREEEKWAASACVGEARRKRKKTRGK